MLRPIRLRICCVRALVLFLSAVVASTLAMPLTASAFSSVIPFTVHQRLLKQVFLCAGSTEPPTATDCFESGSLAVLQAAVQAPDLSPSDGGEETIAAAHCDNADFVSSNMLRLSRDSLSGIEARIRQNALTQRDANPLLSDLRNDFDSQYAVYRGGNDRPYPQTLAQANTNLAACIARYADRVNSLTNVAYDLRFANPPGSPAQTSLSEGCSLPLIQGNPPFLVVPRQGWGFGLVVPREVDR